MNQVVRKTDSSTVLTWRRRKIWAGVLLGIFLSGVIFRFAEYRADRSLWLDEAALAQNILHLPLGELAAGRLGDRQVAPPGFLLAVRAVVALGGESEQMLRLIPLLAGLATLSLISWVAWRRLNPVGAVTTVMLTAWSWPLIYYSNECKQYSTDALCAILLFMLAGKTVGQPLTVRHAIAVGAAGLVALIFSQPALFGLAALCLLGIAEKMKQKNKRELMGWIAMGAAWGLFFALQMWLSFDSTLGNTALFAHHEETFLRLWPLAEAWQVWHDNVVGTWIYATTATTWWIWLGLLALGFW